MNLRPFALSFFSPLSTAAIPASALLSFSAPLRSCYPLVSESLPARSRVWMHTRRRVLCIACVGPDDNDVSAPPDGPNSSDDARGILEQMKEIVLFAGPAWGLWICGPLMSLIDTMFVAQGSSLQLAAMGPGTVFCDYLNYVFMFLSVSTSNLVATSLARKDKDLAQHQISMLLCVALICGLAMVIFSKLFSTQVLIAFAGQENLHLIPFANSYVQIRALAWPAVLVGLVAQSSCLGMKDAWGPLNALVVATVINVLGDFLLCYKFHYGIAGAAWATAISQLVAAFMMIGSLEKMGFSGFSITIPSPGELLQIFEIAAPVFITMTTKVAFYSLLTYFATSLGTLTIAAHQVMINIYCMCTVWGEPLSQTAQSFMPELIHGTHRSLLKARMLLKSLVVIGLVGGIAIAILGTLTPWRFPAIFSPDLLVICEMQKVLFPYFFALVATPLTHSFEGTLLAGRDLKFLSVSMTGCFFIGSIFLLFLCNRGSVGLAGCWWALAGFQWARCSIALGRLLSPTGVLYNEDFYRTGLLESKAV